MSQQPSSEVPVQPAQPSVGSLAAHRPHAVAGSVPAGLSTAADLDPDLDNDPDAYEPESDGDELPQGRFLDRERSWLAFNERVLELAEDPATPYSNGLISSPSSRRTWTSSSWSGQPASSAVSRPVSPPGPPPGCSPAKSSI